MHKRTFQIIKNLGFNDDIINNIKQNTQSLNRKTISKLKKLGIPDAAIKQIKFLEDYPHNYIKNTSNQDLIKTLAKKCKRSLDSFSKKNTPACIVFKNNDWIIYSPQYNKAIENLYKICKPYFDEWCIYDIEATFIFDGSSTWKILTNKK